MEAFKQGGLDWVYLNDIERVWKDWLRSQADLTTQENEENTRIESSL